MNFLEYAKLSRRTIAPLPSHIHEIHMVAGIVTELGELIDSYKKHIAYNKPLDIVNIQEEIGDIAFYIAGLFSDNDLKSQITINILSDPTKKDLFFEVQEIKKRLSKRYGTKREIDFSSLDNLSKLNLMLNINSNVVHVLETLRKEDLTYGNMLLNTHSFTIMTIVSNLIVLCEINEVKFEDMLKNNVEKLSKRYPEKFTEENALNRDIQNELNHY